MKTVALYTLGCKVSQYETEAIAERFEACGFRVVPFTDTADVYVINTCTVTAESDRKSRQMIRRAIKGAPNAIVMVTGCYAQVSSADLMKITGVAYVGGTQEKMKIPEIALSLLEKRENHISFSPVCATNPLDGAVFERMTVKHAPRTRAYVKIEDGCECRCAYCAIPGARGNVRSKAPEDILAEVEALALGGTKEIVLTGIEIASYGKDFDGFLLIDLLELIDRKIQGVRFRLGSITPEIMKEDFVNRLSKIKSIVPHFHISMQSGSEAVLRGMKRRYSAKMAMDSLTLLRNAIPGVRFTTDMMTGFPGEGDREFEETLAFSQKAHFLDMHVFAYSKRKNTPAALYPDQVDEATKRERSARLIALASRMKAENLLEITEAGESLSVLFETREGKRMVGHSAEYVEVHVETEKELHGVLCRVFPASMESGVILGTLIED